jgi:hypothetical protein
MYLAALVGLLLVTTACGNDGTRPAPSAIPLPAAVPDPAPPAAPPVPNINVGEDVQEALTVHGSAKLLELTAPSDGTLVVQLSWNANQGSLELWLDEQQFMGASLIVGKLRVATGSKHLIKIADGAPWDYNDLYVRFVVAASLEPPSALDRRAISVPNSLLRVGVVGVHQ